MNHVILSGRLTRDPNLIDNDGRAICHMRVAVDNGKYATTYVNVSTFDAQAEACAEHLSKGRKVGVSGKLTYDEWRDAAENRRESYGVIGRVEFLDRPPTRQPDPVPSEPQSPEPELELEGEAEAAQLAVAA